MRYMEGYTHIHIHIHIYIAGVRVHPNPIYTYTYTYKCTSISHVAMGSIDMFGNLYMYIYEID